VDGKFVNDMSIEAIIDPMALFPGQVVNRLLIPDGSASV
jgi:hypothetical protein